MHAIATKPTCPYCSNARFWKLRRAKFKCKKCRREWSPRTLSQGIRAAPQEWRFCISAFLKQRAGLTVSKETGIGYVRTQKMLTRLRERMPEDVPEPFSGTCEADETFLGGQWKNKRRSVRKLGTKKGHGTSKAPVAGVLGREAGQVRVLVLEKRSGKTYWGFIRSCLAEDCLLYTDGYRMNRGVTKYGIAHDFVDRSAGEYVRGDVHANGIEGFRGYLKRNLAMVGGIRRDRLHLFVGEFVWRYNFRNLTHEEKVERLFGLLKP